MAANSRTYTGANWIINVGGSAVAMVKKFDGLSMEADIVDHNMGPLQYQAKNVANIKWTPGKLTIGTGMGNEMYQWMQSALQLQAIQKNGSVITGDFDHNAQTELTFMNALITSIQVPKLSGDSKEGLYFDVEFDAEQVRWAPGKGKIDGATYGVKQKAHLAANWHLDIPGLPCDRIASVDAVTWKCELAQDQIGINREPTKHPAKVSVSDLKVSVSMADYDAWAKKAKDWFVDGHHLNGDEVDCTLTLLGPDMKDQNKVGTIEFKRCGMKKFAKEALEANNSKVARFTCDFYVEQMDMKITQYDA